MNTTILIAAAAAVAGFVIGFILGAIILKAKAEIKIRRIGQAMGKMGGAQLWIRALKVSNKL